MLALHSSMSHLLGMLSCLLHSDSTLVDTRMWPLSLCRLMTEIRLHYTLLVCQHTSLEKEYTTFETPHDKTNKMACAPSKDSDQPSLISLCCPHEGSLGPKLSIKHTAKTNQTGQMPRLIWHICHFVGFVMRQLIYNCYFTSITVLTGVQWNR